MEIQSSPVLMMDREIFTLVDLLICIPSVFGLSAGEVMLSLYALNRLLLVMCMWNPMAFIILIDFTLAFVTLVKYRDCTKHKRYN